MLDIYVCYVCIRNSTPCFTLKLAQNDDISFNNDVDANINAYGDVECCRIKRHCKIPSGELTYVNMNRKT